MCIKEATEIPIKSMLIIDETGNLVTCTES